MNDPLNPEMVVFNTAIELDSSERAAYLEKACGGDADLLHRLKALLKAHEAAGNFLKDNGPGAPLFPADFAVTTHETGMTAVCLTEKPGDRIGRYKLLQQIGEGGCGVVYMAEQVEPVRRQVALKVIKLGMDTKSVIARFEAERQALALMDHPNIAKVLDAGATDTGRPYFVMELVRGIKITHYCDENTLSTVARLELFIQVCHAIQHAHQKGVIHRDIKPSNILVTMNDGVPLPKVIDFGIAKATQGRLTDKTLFTAFEQFIGTPAYMSPEQAEMSALDIDTRSDIYSLGVLLYELITGQTPFSAKTLPQANLDEIRRTIREEEAARPSNCLSTMQGADLTMIAKYRKVDPPKLINLVLGDLDWIVMKALEKDRTRRYETANGLAADILRHLSNEAVVARPPSNLYRFQKLVRRNKIAFLTASMVATALLIGIAVSAWQAVRATRAERQQRVLREQAQTQEAKAKTAALKSQLVAKFLADMLLEVDPAVAKGRDTTLLREFLDKVTQRVQTEITDQPSVQADLLSTVGAVYLRIGLFTKAETMDREALELRGKAGGDDEEMAISMINLAHVLNRMFKNNDEARKLDQDALVILRKNHGQNNDQVAVALSGLADSLDNVEQFAEAELLCREVLDIRKKLSGAESFSVSSAQHALAFNLRKEGKLGEAEILSRQELELRRKLLKGEDHVSVAESLCSLADVLADEGHSLKAENTYRQALAIQHKILGDDHPDTLKTLYAIGHVLLLRGDGTRYGEAESLLREAVAKRRQIYGNEHPFVTGAMADLISLLLAEKKNSEALALMLDLAEKGNPFFQARLGQMYQAGEGVPQDATLAGKWFAKAAENTNFSSKSTNAYHN